MSDRYIDPETGGYVDEAVIVQRYYEKLAAKQRYEWFKTYPKLLKPLGDESRTQSPRVTVLLWIFGNLNPGDNTFTGKNSFIAEETKVALSTVQRTLKLLVDYDFIRRTRDDRWMANPYVVHAGDDSRKT